MTTRLLERPLAPRTRENALQLAFDAMAMAHDQNDQETADYIVRQLADALRASWQDRTHVRMRPVPDDDRRDG